MKNTINFVTKGSAMLLIAFTLFSCNNDDSDVAPIDQLPEATQTGRGIFGALVDGEAFVETNNFFNTFYQQVDGEFFFGIQGEVDDRDPRSIGVGTNALELQEGTTIILTDNVPGNAWGGVFFNPETNVFESVETNSQNQGTLTITKLDFENNIVSGTFEMTVEDPFTGELVQITEGRFDTLFTQ
jgi:hypothetical protein